MLRALHTSTIVFVFVFVDLFLVFYVGRHVGSLNVCCYKFKST